MAIQIGGSGADDEVMSVINTTPLVDVMLVLLIIFLITIPAVTSSVPVKLPQQRVEERRVNPGDIVISIDAEGHIFWQDTALQSHDDLLRRLSAAALQQPQPEVHIRGDMRGSYAGTGRVLYACQQAGIARVAVITDPGSAS